VADSLELKPLTQDKDFHTTKKDENATSSSWALNNDIIMVGINKHPNKTI